MKHIPRKLAPAMTIAADRTNGQLGPDVSVKNEFEVDGGNDCGFMVTNDGRRIGRTFVDSLEVG